MFTHHIDVGGWVTRSAHQAGCAAHHFDFVENGRVACGITKIPAVIEESGHIFIGKVADEETARIEVGTAGIDARRTHTDGIIQHRANGVQLLILHTLLAHDADRLGNITRNQQ